MGAWSWSATWWVSGTLGNRLKEIHINTRTAVLVVSLIFRKKNVFDFWSHNSRQVHSTTFNHNRQREVSAHFCPSWHCQKLHPGMRGLRGSEWDPAAETATTAAALPDLVVVSVHKNINRVKLDHPKRMIQNKKIMFKTTSTKQLRYTRHGWNIKMINRSPGHYWLR